MEFYSVNAELKPVTHIIFDMDGVILDTEKLYTLSYGNVVSRFGKVYTEEVKLAHMATVDSVTAQICVERLGLPLSPEEFAIKAKEEQFRVMGDAALMPGAERLIKHFHSHNIPIAIATSSGEDTFKVKTAKHKALFDCFNHIVKGSSDSEVVNGKPAPDIYLIAASRFPTPPDPKDCLVIEDAPNGVIAARRAGMQVVMVPDSMIPEKDRSEATMVIDSLLEFEPELFGLPPVQK